jgi:spermidine/putrescine transport system ATP-binding protein
VLQIGPAEEIYERPTSRFVADFIGETNLISGRVSSISDGVAGVQLYGGRVMHAQAGAAASDSEVTVAVRPERIRFAGHGEATEGLEGVIAEAVYLGSAIQYVVLLPDGRSVTVRRPVGDEAPRAAGAAVRLAWDPRAATVLTS